MERGEKKSAMPGESNIIPANTEANNIQNAAQPGVLLRSVSEVVPRWRNAALSLLCLGFVILSACFVCFYNLERGKLTIPDESNEVQAAIEMLQGEHWWLPTYNGKPYLHKPPLKMWLTWPAIEAFTGTNFSFRFVDACSGVGICVLIYCMALHLFSSRLAGLSAVFAFLGCDIIVRYHGVRTANQDAALLFFSTLAIVAAWAIVRRAIEQYPAGAGSFAWAVLGGLSLACAVLTKSGAGLISLIVVASYALLSGQLLRIFRFAWKPILLTLFVAAAGAAAYFVPVCFAHEGAFDEFFIEHIYGRILSGHGNVNPPLFYLDRLFLERGAVPPELILLGLLFALYRWRVHADQRYSFLFFWCVIPVLCFSFSKTKLSWYIAASLPAMALLVAGLVAASIEALQSKRSVRWQQGSASVLLLLCISTLGYNLYLTTASVLPWKQRIAFDTFVESVRVWEKDHARNAHVALYQAFKPSVREKPYLLLLEPTRFEKSDRKRLIAQAESRELDFIISRLEAARLLAAEIPFTQFRLLAPERERRSWLTILSTVEQEILPGFQPMRSLMDFGTGQVAVLDGFFSSDRMGRISIRWMFGPRASFLAPGHEYFGLQGAKMLLSLTANVPGDILMVDVVVNTKTIGRLKLRSGDGRTRAIEVPAGILHAGDNVISFELSKKSGRPIAKGEKLLMVNWVSLRLPLFGFLESDT